MSVRGHAGETHSAINLAQAHPRASPTSRSRGGATTFGDCYPVARLAPSLAKDEPDSGQAVMVAGTLSPPSRPYT